MDAQPNWIASATPKRDLPAEISALKARRAQIRIDETYQYSDDHQVWSRNNELAQQAAWLDRRIAALEQLHAHQS